MAQLSKREARKHSRRQSILKAARKSFLEKGYAATSMSGLLETLGGSKATLWSYFRSKEDLFAAVVEDATLAFREQIESEVLVPGGLDAALVAFCHGFMRMLADSETVALWRLIVGESGRFPELGQILYARAAGQVERALASYLDQQIAAGLLVDEGSERMAAMLLGLCAADHSRHLLGIGRKGSDDIGADARRFTEYFLRLFGEGRSRTGG